MYSLMTKVVKYRRFTSIALATMFVLMGLLGTVMAASTEGAEAVQELHNKVESLGDQIKRFGVGVCVVCAVYIGVMFIASSVNPKLREQAKAGLWGLVFGVLVLVLSDQLANIIAGFTNSNLEGMTPQG